MSDAPDRTCTTRELANEYQKLNAISPRKRTAEQQQRLPDIPEEVGRKVEQDDPEAFALGEENLTADDARRWPQYRERRILFLRVRLGQLRSRREKRLREEAEKGNAWFNPGPLDRAIASDEQELLQLEPGNQAETEPAEFEAGGAMEEKKFPNAQPVRHITKAPRPPIELSGRGCIPPEPKPTQVLTDFPPYYPNDLKVQTTVIIGKALKKFPVQTQTLQLCKYVVSKMTPHFCAAIERKTLRADQALSSMSDLLHNLLVVNCGDSSPHAASEKRFRLKQEIENSEWLKLAKKLDKVAKAQAAADAVRPPDLKKAGEQLQPAGVPNDGGSGNRKGYKAEVRQWMKRRKVEKLDDATPHLGVSVDVLKSIMSDKGKPRYGKETLESVLKKIGYKKA